MARTGAAATAAARRLNKSTDLALVMQTVKEGRKNMPPFGAALSAEQIQAVSSYRRR